MATRASSIQSSRKKSQLPGSHQQLGSRRGALPKPISEPRAWLRSKREYIDQNSSRPAGPTDPGFIDPVCSTHVRRTMNQYDIRMANTQSPDLLKIFNSFQINATQDQRPPVARVLVTVILFGGIQSIRLLVGYDASVRDVIRASLKAYAKEGLVPRKSGAQDPAAYGLHYSPFCLQSISPTEAVHCLGTRSFFLYPSSSRQLQLDPPLKESQSFELCHHKGNPWWKICDVIVTCITQFLQMGFSK